MTPKHLVLATGMSGFPEIPRFPGAELFKGTQHHSSRHTGGEGWAGKRCVVVGSNNSAHDIAADLWEHGADVTLLQRSPTLVMRAETLARNRPLYSEAALAAGITTEIADLTTASMPYGAAARRSSQPMVEQIRREDADFYARLGAAGFKLTFGEDETGIGPMYLRRGSGYYIDVGASELIADGRIKLKSGVEVARLTADSVVLNDGSELQADLVVYATGYGSMNQWAGELISPEVADKVGKCWGLGSDTAKDPGPVGGRAAQHVEADGAGEPVVPWRQPHAVPALFAVPGAAAQGAAGGIADAGLRPGAGPSPGVIYPGDDCGAGSVD